MSNSAGHAASRRRPIRARRIGFDYGTERVTRHFVNDGDPVMSAVIAVLSGLFPEGEDFFVRSVRGFREQVDDPDLRRQVGGFIGQEAMHGREHREFNDRLARLGHPTRRVDRYVAAMARLSEKTESPARRLAATAAFEHYTATLAEVLLGDERARAMLADDEVRNLFLWHAVEESEHKTVAFDVFQDAVGNERMRRWVMNATTVWFLGSITFWSTFALITDADTYRHPGRVLRGLLGLRDSPFLTSAVVRRIRDYNRPGFHPDDHDATALLTEWRTKLFGDDGTLAARVRTPEVVVA